MKVILLQNIKGVGQIGDIKSVTDGYGRNYLLTRKLAKVATANTLQEVAGLKKKAEVEMKLAYEKAGQVAEKIKDLILKFTKKASKTGKLFASLTKEEVAESLSKIIGSKMSPDSIDFKEHGKHIKQEGEHVIEVELAPASPNRGKPEIKVEIRVLVKGG